MANIFTKTTRDIGYLFSNEKATDTNGKKRKKHAIAVLIGFIFAAIQLSLAITLSVKLSILDLLPDKYFIPIIIILCVLLIYCTLAQFSRSHNLGKIVSLLSSAAMVVGIIVISDLSHTFDNITKTQNQTNVIDIIVPIDSAFDEPKDLDFGYVAINTMSDGNMIEKAVRMCEKDNDISIKTHSYNTWEKLLDGLYSDDTITSAILSESMYEILKEQHPDLAERTKVLGTICIETELVTNDSVKNITETPFVAYISGNDSTGKISDSGRSDVNILAVVNPTTKKILLVSTPRDYYINITNSDGRSGFDKLTHAGNYGTKASIKALEDLYKTDIDYYCKVNFTGCTDIIDALGGITIDSEVEFTSTLNTTPSKYHFVKGKNYCDGAKALAFMRERNAFAAGDFQRGRNQQATISAIIAKATSPAILANYASVLDAVSNMLVTNMPAYAISDLIKAQLNNPTAWDITTYNATALSTSIRDCQVSGVKNVDVVIPDYNSVNEAIRMINETLMSQ